MATANSTTLNNTPTLLDAEDMLSEARSMAVFVQSMAINIKPDQSITLHPDQISGMHYVLQGVIDRIELAERAIICAREMPRPSGNQHPKEPDSIAGGIAGFNALREIERIAKQSVYGATMDDWWKIQDDITNTVLNAAGEKSAFVTGFLSTFAEYVGTVHTAGILHLDKWKPEATMTETEKLAERTAFGEEVEAGKKPQEFAAEPEAGVPA